MARSTSSNPTRSTKRTFSTIILLMVMMLQVGVKTFHQHHHEETERVSCSDCEHNRIHDGHILSWDGSSTDCALCQLFSTPYCKAPDAPSNKVLTSHPTYGISSIGVPAMVAPMHITPRAPPAFLL